MLVVGMTEVVGCRENRVCSFNRWRCAGSGFVCVFWGVASSSIFPGLSASNARDAGSATCFTGSEYERDGCAIVVLSKCRPLVGVRCNSVSPPV